MVNGRPYSVENGWEDSALMDSLDEEAREICLKWIRSNIVPKKSPNYQHTSYGMKHLLERDTQIYLTNNQFKDAMLMCGFFPTNEKRLNWTYCISKKSPAFKKKVW